MLTVTYCILIHSGIYFLDAPGLQEKASVTKLQSKMLNSLRVYVMQSSSDPCRYGKILLRLPTLRTVSMKAAEKFLSMSIDGDIRMNDLVLEIMS